jgi:hypothetical protein
MRIGVDLRADVECGIHRRTLGDPAAGALIEIIRRPAEGAVTFSYKSSRARHTPAPGAG